MKTIVEHICLGLLLAAMLAQPALAQPAADDAGAQRMQGGGINYAPQPAVYAVTLVDPKAGTVRLRAEDGRTGLVQVAKGVYDLSKLKPGDKIRVDFVAPVAPVTVGAPLRAASVWPVQ